MTTPPRLIVAADYADPAPVRDLAAALSPQDCALKIGSELFTAAGPAVVRELTARGFKIFLDLKFHDIPHTVARACAQAAALGVWMLDVHVGGGEAMLRAAVRAVRDFQPRPLLVGVTVLTSLDEIQLRGVGVGAPPAAQVLRLAALAGACGLDGVVCSPRECAAVKRPAPPGFICVTPGIRAASDPGDDQIRTATPAAALREGADYLVVGRPITQAPDPGAAARRLQAQLRAAYGSSSAGASASGKLSSS